MVSAKRFLQDEPVLGRALRLFVERFANLDDPVLQVSAHAKTDDEKIAWTLDGEYGGSFNEVSYEVRPKAVDFIVKRTRKHDA